MNNESLLVISKVLGHTDVSITARVYAHLQVDKARTGMETAVSAMLDAANATTGDAFCEGLKRSGEGGDYWRYCNQAWSRNVD